MAEQVKLKKTSRKSRQGVVVSNRMQKTVVVKVSRRVKHARYGKYLTKTKRYYAHDEAGSCKLGDTVRIVETRPFSKLKRWRVQEIVKRGVE